MNHLFVKMWENTCIILQTLIHDLKLKVHAKYISNAREREREREREYIPVHHYNQNTSSPVHPISLHFHKNTACTNIFYIHATISILYLLQHLLILQTTTEANWPGLPLQLSVWWKAMDYTQLAKAQVIHQHFPFQTDSSKILILF